MTTWKDIITKPGWSDLEPDVQMEVRRQWLIEDVAPALANDPDREAVMAELWNEPLDTGQGLASSALNSAARGFSSLLPGVVGGLGVVTGVEELEDAGNSIEGSINEALPVNPALADTWTVKGAGAIGNAAGFLATGFAGGAVGKTLGGVRMVRAGSEATSLGAGFLGGTHGGAQSADQLGLTGGDRYLRAIIGGTTEVVSEKMLFGLGTETAAARKLLGDSVEGKWFNLLVGAYSEAGEEGFASLAGNIADKAMAPQGVDTGSIFESVAEDAALGGIAGFFMGGVNTGVDALTRQPEQSTTPPTSTTVEGQSAPSTPAPSVATPVQPVTILQNGQPFAWDGQQWNIVVTADNLESLRSRMDSRGMVPLNPADPVDGGLIPRLNAENARLERATQPLSPPPSEPSDLGAGANTTPGTGDSRVVESPNAPVAGILDNPNNLNQDTADNDQSSTATQPPPETGTDAGEVAPSAGSQLQAAAAHLRASFGPSPEAPSRDERSKRIETERDALIEWADQNGLIRIRQPGTPIGEGSEHTVTQPPGPSEGEVTGTIAPTAPAGGPVASGQLNPARDRIRDMLSQASAVNRGEAQGRKPAAIERMLNRAADAQLPDPTGADLISAMQAQRLRLGGPARGAAEWEWYEQLEREAARSPIRQQTADAMARRGEIDDPKAMLAWIHQQNLVDPKSAPGNLDEVAGILSGETQSTSEDTGPAFQSFSVSATELGPAILDAIDTRAKARTQPDPIDSQEADQIEQERATMRTLIIESAQSPGPEFSGLSLSNQLAEGDAVTINGKTWTAADIDPDAGNLVLISPEGSSAFIQETDILRVESINGQSQQEVSIDTDDTPFSLTPDGPTAQPLLDGKPISGINTAAQMAGTVLANAQGNRDAAIKNLKAGRVNRGDNQQITEAESAINYLQNGRVTLRPYAAPDYESDARNSSEYRRELQRNINALADRLEKSTWYQPAHRYAVSSLRYLASRAGIGYMQNGDSIKPPIYREGYRTHRSAYNRAIADANQQLQNLLGERLSDPRYSIGNTVTLPNPTGAMDATGRPVGAQTQTPPLPRDPSSRIEAINADLRKTLGLRRLPARVQIVHTNEPATLKDGTKAQWKAKVQKGRITLNAANLNSAADALWNLEHELAHEAFRDPSPTLKRAWNRLTKALAKHPDIRQQVEDLRYTPDQLTEEQSVRLAQKLDTEGPWSAAWSALKEAVWNFFKGKGWGNIKTIFSDRIAAALAARAIMADARARLAPQTEVEMTAFLATAEAAAFSFQPSDLNPDGTPKREVLAEIAREKAEIEARAKADGTWMKAPNGQRTKLNDGQWVAVRTKRFKEWFGDWQSLAEEAAFASTVDAIVAGTYDMTRPVALGSTPETWIVAGADPLPITMPPSMVKKVTQDAHDLPVDIVRQIASGIKNPVFVFESASVPDALTVILDLKHKGQNVLVAVHLNKQEGNHEVNRIASIYDKSNPRGVEGWMKDGLLRYAHQQKSRDWFRSRGLQLPKEGTPRGKSNLRTDADIVNRSVNPNSVSKVVDENGEPMVVYHGTSEDFTSFDPKEDGGQQNAIWSTDNPDIANFHALKWKMRTGANVMPLFLRLTTPLVTNADGKLRNTNLVKTAKQQERDGVIYQNANDAKAGNGTLFVAFDPTQIKSAIANTGTYSNETGDIRYSLAPGQQDLFDVPADLPPPSSPPQSMRSKWPDVWQGFPNVQFVTTYQQVMLHGDKRRKPHPDPDKKTTVNEDWYFAKGHGDETMTRAEQESHAARLLQRIVSNNPQQAAAQIDFVRQHPNAILAPIRGLEAPNKRANTIPAVFAREIAGETGNAVAQDFVKTNTEHNTSKNAKKRLFATHSFAGTITPGSDYIIVDDISTTGATAHYAARYIESQGGNVIGVVQLGISRRNPNRRAKGDTHPEENLAMSDHTRQKLLSLAPKAILNQVVQLHGIANHWLELTDGLGRALNSNWDSARTVLSRGKAGGSQNQSGGQRIQQGAQYDYRSAASIQPTPGRAQPLDAPVLTPEGYRRMGELAIGDTLASTDGQNSTVIGVFPQGPKRVFKLTLSDGRTVRATEDHLWIAQFNGDQHMLPVQTRYLAWNMERGIKINLPVMAG